MPVGRRLPASTWPGTAERPSTPLVASPLLRAVETAQAVASRAGVELEIDSRLIDRDYGRWAGQPKEVIEAQWGSLDEAPGVEPEAEVRARAGQALADIARRVEGELAVVVSHDAVIRVVMATLEPSIKVPDHLPLEPGRFNTLECRAGRWTAVSSNEIPDAAHPPNS